jgi:hypothetical protein
MSEMWWGDYESPMSSLFHYTDQPAYNAIRSQVVWHFVAAQPPGQHPFGAYFTTLGRTTRNLAQKLRIPKAKIAFFFELDDLGDLAPLPGGRGQFIVYSLTDYDVDQTRQIDHGVT